MFLKNNQYLLQDQNYCLINYFKIDLCQALYNLEGLRVCINTSCVDLSIASSLDAVISYKVLAVGYSLYFLYYELLVVMLCLFYWSVLCPSLTDPNNGTITCSLGDDGVPSYEDTCSFTCNTGYELTGSDTRTCQSDGSWSGTATVCRRGNFMNPTVHNINFMQTTPV